MFYAQAEFSLPKGKELFEKNYGVAAMYEEVTEEVAAANEERKPHLLFSSF
jgi:hypothetical protein